MFLFIYNLIYLKIKWIVSLSLSNRPSHNRNPLRNKSNSQKNNKRGICFIQSDRLYEKAWTYWRWNRGNKRSIQFIWYWRYRQSGSEGVKSCYVKSWLRLKKSNHLQHDCRIRKWRVPFVFITCFFIVPKSTLSNFWMQLHPSWGTEKPRTELGESLNCSMMIQPTQ